MDLKRLEAKLINLLAKETDHYLTRIESCAIFELFNLGKDPFKRKYWIFYPEEEWEID